MSLLFYTGAMQSESTHSHPLRLSARVALLMLLAYSVALFFVDTWLGMLVFTVAAAVAVALSGASLRRIGACLAPLMFILACTVLFQIPRGIEAGLFYAVRIVLLALGSFVVAFSYDDAQFVHAFQSLLAPFRVLRIPVDDIATMFSIALRFIPEGVDEFHRVEAAQRSRAASFDDGALVARIARWGGVFIPLLVGMFRRAGVLACAMEARCYGARLSRTSLHGDEKFAMRDWSCLLACVVAVLVLSYFL